MTLVESFRPLESLGALDRGVFAVGGVPPVFAVSNYLPSTKV